MNWIELYGFDYKGSNEIPLVHKMYYINVNDIIYFSVAIQKTK